MIFCISPECLVAIFTGLLVVVTAVLAIYTYKLWAAAKVTAQRQLRAYLSVDTENIVDENGKVIPNRYGFIIKNHGQTPAHKMEHWTQLDVCKFPLVEELEKPNKDRLIIQTVLHPGNDRFIIGDFFLDQKEFDAIRAGTHAWYAWGCVNYEDCFGEPHWTKFCFFIDNDALKMQRWAHYKTGNDAT